MRRSAHHGAPTTRQHLARHKLPIYVNAHNPDPLRFARDGQTLVLPVQGLLKANDGQVLRAAALKHLDILVQPMYIVHEDVVAGRLVPVLREWELPRLTVNVAYPSRRHQPAKVRCFVDFLVEQFEKNDYERRWTA